MLGKLLSVSLAILIVTLLGSGLCALLCWLVVGAVLVIIPWTSLWDANYLLQPHPAIRGFLLSAFTRGAVSGLGLVNILLALHDAHRYLTDAGEGS